MANSQDDSYSQHPDLLAAVVLHTLVSEARDGMTVAAVAVACERDPDTERDIEEIVAALEILLGDGLAEREPTPLREPDAGRRPDSAQEHATGNLNTALEPDTSPQPLYRPTRAAIRAHELSF
ncbi:MAG TPA: hypothetical protein VHY18_01880 [Solirubrobacteraceae bacterium]|nr:hypothetical protein [Solirubrobacteraceae bacterium]